jgi:glycerol-3-phosphate cytidylyltransferase
MNVAYCGGTFDLLHPGHVRFFKWVKTNFDVVIAALNTDEFVKRYKASPPSQTFGERQEMLFACRYVDAVIENVGAEDSKPSIIAAKATHIVNGSDWNIERLKVQMGLTDEFLTEYKLTIIICPLPRELSTTGLKARIIRNDSDGNSTV